MGIEQLVGDNPAQGRIADQHRHDMTRRMHHRHIALAQKMLHAGGAALQPLAFHIAVAQMTHGGKRACGNRRRQRGGENKSGGK